MKPDAFLEPYTRDQVRNRPLSDRLETLLEPVDRWGLYFGEVLYDYLDGRDDTNTEFNNQLKVFRDWSQKGLSTINKQFYEHDEPYSDSLQALGRLTFCSLTRGMLDQWALEGKRGGRNDAELFFKAGTLGQARLALDAVRGFIGGREQLAGQRLGYMYFGSDLSETRGVVEGILNEFDAAIVLMEIGKRHGLTVLPAPPQFERGKISASNVDFIVIGPDREAVGVQVKTSATQEMVDHYTDNVVILDARVDMANEMVRKTSKISSPKVTGWAGIISAQKVLRLQTKGPHAIMGQNPNVVRSILNTQALVRSKTTGFSDGLPTAVRRIEPRLFAKMALTDTDEVI